MRFRPSNSSVTPGNITPIGTITSPGANLPDSYLPIPPVLPDSYLPMKGYRKIQDGSAASEQKEKAAVEPGVNTIIHP